MASIDKKIEEKLEMYRRQKQNEKKDMQSLAMIFRNTFQTWSSHLVRYLLPDNIPVGDTSLKLNNVDNRRTSNELNPDENMYNILKDKKGAVCKSHRLRGFISAIVRPEEIVEEKTEVTASYSKIDWMILLLKIVLWFILWKLFILIEFGAVFFICSCLLFIWLSLYSGSHRRGLSAYSVFNPNCEELLGAYTAEKFEKELLHR